MGGNIDESSKGSICTTDYQITTELKSELMWDYILSGCHVPLSRLI